MSADWSSALHEDWTDWAPPAEPAVLTRTSAPPTRVRDAARAAVYRAAFLLLLLLVGLGAMTAVRARLDHQCQYLLDRHDLVAYDAHACPPLTTIEDPR